MSGIEKGNPGIIITSISERTNNNGETKRTIFRVPRILFCQLYSRVRMRVCRLTE